eukprot:Skav212086  [mRNA]  locus=scaffold4509:9109:13217:+ [translate_table: standard]
MKLLAFCNTPAQTVLGSSSSVDDMIEVQYWKYPLRWVPTRLEAKFAHPRDRDFIFETVDLPKCFNNVHRVAMQDRESWWRLWQATELEVREDLSAAMFAPLQSVQVNGYRVAVDSSGLGILVQPARVGTVEDKAMTDT